VIDLFAAAGLEDARLDIFFEEFLTRVAALEQKNLALEKLRKLLTDQIRSTERTNPAQRKKFREAIEDAMVRYANKAITTAEKIVRLLDIDGCSRCKIIPGNSVSAPRRRHPCRIHTASPQGILEFLPVDLREAITGNFHPEDE